MAAKKRKEKAPPPPGVGASAEELAAYFEKYGLDELETAGYVKELSADEEEEMGKLAAALRERLQQRKLGRKQLNLAMSAEQLESFTQYANAKHIPPSTLAKAWILERLDKEAKEA